MNMVAKIEDTFISKSFSRVLVGQIISVTGSNATAVVIPLIAVITLNCSSFEVGILTAAESLAAAIFGIQIGKWCDKIGPDKTMLLSNLIGAMATGALFVVLYLNIISFPALVFLMLVIGVASLGFDISRTGYTVALVPRERIPHANSLIEGANAVGEGIGPSIGGWLFNTVGSAFSLLFDFASYLTSSLLVFVNIHQNKQEYAQYDQQEHDAEDADEIGNDYLAGFKYVISNGIIKSIAFSAGQFNFFTSAFFTVYYVFVVRNLNMNATEVGLAATFSGIAGIVSAAVTGTIIKKITPGPLYIYSLIVPSLAAVLVPLSSIFAGHSSIVLITVCISQFLWSFAITVSVILGESIKQIVAPEGMLGQVSSAERMIALVAEPIGALAGGLCAGAIGEKIALYICVLGLDSSALWTLGKDGILSFKKPKEW